MILLDTDTLTLWLMGQPLVSKRVLGSSEDVAITVVSRIELLQESCGATHSKDLAAHR
jgi:hypothetical protein